MIDTTIFQDKTAVYYTLGCKLNFSETSTIGKTLKEAVDKAETVLNYLRTAIFEE